MNLLALAPIAAALPLSASAFEVDESEYVHSSDLAKRGFVPFATSPAIQSIHGMRDGKDLHLCFSLNQPAEQMWRRQAPIAEIEGQSQQRMVTNMPVVCILAQQEPMARGTLSSSQAGSLGRFALRVATRFFMTPCALSGVSAWWIALRARRKWRRFRKMRQSAGGSSFALAPINRPMPS